MEGPRTDCRPTSRTWVGGSDLRSFQFRHLTLSGAYSKEPLAPIGAAIFIDLYICRYVNLSSCIFTSRSVSRLSGYVAKSTFTGLLATWSVGGVSGVGWAVWPGGVWWAEEGPGGVAG